MITYKIEVWNPLTNKYFLLWSGHDFERAKIMFDKPYNRKSTRRMIKIEEEILYKEKAQKK